MKFLQGKKTYLVAAAAAGVTFAHALGWIDSDLTNTLYGLLGASGAATMAAKVNRTTP